MNDVDSSNRTMSDKDGPLVAQWVYEALLNKEIFELDDIPYVLDDAVQKLKAHGVPLHRWATFVHFGA
jgi:hypothetical protein